MESDHLQMTRRCLDYLLESFSEDIWDCYDKPMRQRYPLMCYSTKAWGYHARNSGAAAIQLLDLYKHFFEDVSIQCWLLSYRRQTTFFDIIHQAMAALEKEVQPLLHIAAELGIIPFVKACFPSRLSPQQKNAHVDEKDGRELSAIKYAAWRVNYEMVQLQLELEANVDDMTVHVAATYNHPGVLTLLLEHGGNVNAKGVEVDTALYDAAGQGLEHVVDILLKYRADANAMSQSQGLTGSDEVPAIAAAAAMTGHESIVRTLLPKTQNVRQYQGGCLE
jgi:hypothetical protein